MQNTRIISDGQEITSVGLGCMGFSHAYGAPTEKNEAVSMIRKAYDMGYNFFDTAECYTGTNADGSTSFNEELVGEALKDVRSKVVIATTFGVRHSRTGLLTDSRPETIRKSVEGSLSRLGVETIDLYYQHRIDPKVEPETVAEVMKELIAEGKIRAWGISETTEDYLRRAHAVCPVAAIQSIIILRSPKSPTPKLRRVRSENTGMSVPATRKFSGASIHESRCTAGRLGLATSLGSKLWGQRTHSERFSRPCHVTV